MSKFLGLRVLHLSTKVHLDVTRTRVQATWLFAICDEYAHDSAAVIALSKECHVHPSLMHNETCNRAWGA